MHLYYLNVALLFFKEESWKSAQIFRKKEYDDSIGLQQEMWQILWNFYI
jgi:hypothetical protein